MNNVRRLLVVLALFGALLLMAACGGSSNSNNNNNSNNNSSSTSTTSNVSNITPATAATNVVAVNVDSGIGWNNTPYVSITICKPGSTTVCSTIPYVLVDTGSYGLRVLNTPVSVTGNQTISSLGLPNIASGSGNLAECVSFGTASYSVFSWGLVQKGDVYIGGETTTTHGSGGIPIHVIGDPSDGNPGDSGFPAVPSSCGKVANAQDSYSTFGLNGILGIGPFIQDCGTSCQNAVPPTPLYYSCSGSSCGSGVTVVTSNQVSNPIAYFADNNGAIIELPNITAASGAQTSAIGSLVFGIGTQANNTLGSANVLTTDEYGEITTQLKGHSYSGSYVDTGSDSYYFLSSSTFASLLGGNPLPACTDSGYFSNTSGSSFYFYCPSSSLSTSATNIGVNGNTIATPFTIANAETLGFLTSPDYAYNDIGQEDPGYFGWGLPLFFGRNVYIGIEGVNPPSGVPAGPFVAY